MKIKTAFTLSLAINAVLLMTVAYMVLINVPLRNEPIIIINHSAPSEQSKNDSTAEPTMAGLPN